MIRAEAVRASGDPMRHCDCQEARKPGGRISAYVWIVIHFHQLGTPVLAATGELP